MSLLREYTAIGACLQLCQPTAFYIFPFLLGFAYITVYFQITHS